MVDQLLDRLIVAVDKAFEFPFVPKNVVERMAIGAGGKTGEAIESTHEGPGTGVNACFELRQIEIAKCVFGDFGGVIIASPFSSAITDVMLHASDNAIGVSDIGPLKSTHVCRGVERAEEWIFAKTFGDAAPAWISAQVHHRGEGPVVAPGGSFARGNSLGVLEKFRLPGACFTERDGKDSAKAVNGIVTEDQRNAETRLLDGNSLSQSVSLRG